MVCTCIYCGNIISVALCAKNGIKPKSLGKSKQTTISEVDDFVIWATLGIILGGRLGYVLFYNPIFYLSHPLEIPQIWKGGMSFHGGSAGIVVAILWFAKRRGLNFWHFFDMLAAAAPIGLFFWSNSKFHKF